MGSFSSEFFPTYLEYDLTSQFWDKPYQDPASTQPCRQRLQPEFYYLSRPLNLYQTQAVWWVLLEMFRLANQGSGGWVNKNKICRRPLDPFSRCSHQIWCDCPNNQSNPISNILFPKLIPTFHYFNYSKLSFSSISFHSKSSSWQLSDHQIISSSSIRISSPWWALEHV